MAQKVDGMQQQSSIFISYRRTDVEFVKRLDQAFRAQGRDVWVDWEDIPPASTDFKEDIIRGIQEADVFIAVLSPDYLESTYCVDLELGYALELQKRIIPVVYRKFDDKPAPNGIGHINWVFFTPHAGQPNTFDEAFPRLIKAIDVDLGHTRMHTRLTVRALEWDKNDRDNSYLLDGIQIEAAEKWLTEGANQRPRATELQIDYINMSRRVALEEQERELTLQRRAINRLRYLAGVLVTFVVVVAGLLVVIVNLQREADAARRLANAQLVQDSLAQGNYEQAIAYSNVNINSYEVDDLFDERGEAYLELGNYQAALDDFNAWLEVSPNNADAYNDRGMALAGLGRYEEALADYNRALDIELTFAEAYDSRGLTYEALQNWENAIDNFSRAIDLEPSAAYYFHRGRTYAQMGQWQNASDDLEQATILEESFEEAYLWLGRTFAAQEQYVEAIRNYSRAITLRFEYAEALYARALAFAQIGAWDFAFIDYGLASTLDDSFGEVDNIVELQQALNNAGYIIGANAQNAGSEQPTEYIVQPYDNAYVVAARFNVPVEAILDANDIETVSDLIVGQTIIIP